MMATDQHAAIWAQLVADTRAFLDQHEGPECVARLVWEASVLGFVHGTRHAVGRSYEQLRADFLKDHAIVAGVLGFATTDDTRHFAALQDLAYAGVRAKRKEEREVREG